MFTETKSIAETQITIIIKIFVLTPHTFYIPSNEIVNLKINNKDSKSYKIIVGKICNVQKYNFTNNFFSKTNIDIKLIKEGKTT